MQPRVVVTGAAGFIGSCLLHALARRGLRDVTAVDYHPPRRFTPYRRFVPKEEFNLLLNSRDGEDIDVIFHQGACSATTCHDGVHMMRHNFDDSMLLLRSCLRHCIRLIYASSAAVYGNQPFNKEIAACESPLNLYGMSKYLFDHQVRRYLSEDFPQIVGLRYFNVFGPGEDRKGSMASIIYQAFQQLTYQGYFVLFGAYGDYGPGQHRRDFVPVEDVIKANLWFLEHPHRRGIFNVGRGESHSFNDIAMWCVNSLRQLNDQPILSLNAMQKQGLIRYCAFPKPLQGSYQQHTCADNQKLWACGYPPSRSTLPQEVMRYIKSLHYREHMGKEVHAKS